MHLERERGISIDRTPGETSRRRNFLSEAEASGADLFILWAAVTAVGVAVGVSALWAVRRFKERGELIDIFPTEFPKIKLPRIKLPRIKK